MVYICLNKNVKKLIPSVVYSQVGQVGHASGVVSVGHGSRVPKVGHGSGVPTVGQGSQVVAVNKKRLKNMRLRLNEKTIKNLQQSCIHR